MLDGLTITQGALPRTVRLVTTARLRESVLLGLVGNEDLAALAEIEGATSNRLLTQVRGSGEVQPYEMVYGMPCAAFINAAFAYAKPREMNRFNGPDRGAWYAGFEIETSLAEVRFHMTQMLATTGVFEAAVDYAELHASFAGDFLDLREHPKHSALNPEKSLGYPAGNALAEAVRVKGHNGIIYPSVRNAGGTCIAALFPHAVQSVAQGAIFRMTWRGSPEPTVERLD
ncbi:MAG: RES family NAD+ phosphorylase [Pseudomonadota bacterium]